MRESYRASAIFMDTAVSIEIVSPTSRAECEEGARRAFGWFRNVEQSCSRFDDGSELMALSAHVGAPVKVSSLLYAVIDFALVLARASHGAFDPTIGGTMEQAGFNRSFRTGRRIASTINSSSPCSYRDVIVDPLNSTVKLQKPMVLDLGAMAKGFATDLAAAELNFCPDFAIDAGGDVLVRGRNSAGVPWNIGIRHPRNDGELLCTLHVSDAAICTSGDYERTRADGKDGHHIIEPSTGRSPKDVASVTVVAPTALLADALSTAAFVLGPVRGVALLERQGVEGLIVASTMRQHTTEGWIRRFIE